MLKKISAFIVVAFVCISAYAQQSYRIYLTQTGEKTDHPEIASSYATVSFMPEDSLWLVQQFDMSNTILTSGYYKDEQLTIAHGKFIYYQKYKALPGNSTLYQDTLNRVQLTGYFLNGARTGPWVQYSHGIKTSVTNFKKDKMDGLYQQFDLETGRVIKEGYYINDLKEGDWCMLAADSTAISTDVFKHGKIIKSLNYSNPVKEREREKEFAKNNRAAVPNFNFQTLVNRTVEHYNYSISSGTFVMTFMITKEGQVTEPKIERAFEASFDELIIRAMLNTRWKPAIKNGEPVKQVQTITINIRDGAIQMPSGSLHKSYDLLRGTYQ